MFILRIKGVSYSLGSLAISVNMKGPADEPLPANVDGSLSIGDATYSIDSVELSADMSESAADLLANTIVMMSGANAPFAEPPAAAEPPAEPPARSDTDSLPGLGGSLASSDPAATADFWRRHNEETARSTPDVRR